MDVKDFSINFGFDFLGIIIIRYNRNKLDKKVKLLL